MEINHKCPICDMTSSSRCSNCLKVAYCGKEHQKQHRKIHKKECFPALIKSHPVLGEHLATSRDIKPGELIFHEEPLIMGPRSNLAEFSRICLGCCAQVGGDYLCSKCRWPLCGVKCESKPWHSKFECPIFAERHVPRATTDDEYLYVTFLRGVLLKYLDPERWLQLKKFESHANSRNTVSLTLKQSQDAYKFMAETCGLKEVDKDTVDFVYGIILVNGYGESCTFDVKLYSKAGKLSHACIPNTRTRVVPSGLDVIAATGIKSDQPLTQLYGTMLKGTHKRQELLQNVYYFSCSCTRCQDPTECATYFSAVKCPGKKCAGYLLPKNPLKFDGNSKWGCDNQKCGLTTTLMKSVIPAVASIANLTGMDEDTPLFTEYEIYIGDNLTNDEETVALARLQFVLQTEEKLKGIEDKIVHRNHYALLPVKTAVISTCHSLLQNLAKFDTAMFQRVLEIYKRLTQEVYQVVNVFLPGFTSERGILLFHLAEGIRLEGQHNGGIHCPKKDLLTEEMGKWREECLKIMELEPDDYPHKILAFEYLGDCKLVESLGKSLRI